MLQIVTHKLMSKDLTEWYFKIPPFGPNLFLVHVQTRKILQTRHFHEENDQLLTRGKANLFRGTLLMHVSGTAGEG